MGSWQTGARSAAPYFAGLPACRADRRGPAGLGDAGAFLAAGFLAAGFLADLAAGLGAGAFFGVALGLATVFFFAGAFLAAGFLAAGFLALFLAGASSGSALLNGLIDLKKLTMAAIVVAASGFVT